jgi:hypothetical protein
LFFWLLYLPFGHALLPLSPSSILIIHTFCSSLIACLIELTRITGFSLKLTNRRKLK